MRFIEPGPKLTLIKGAAWSLATRWGIRLVGFLNTVVMARLVLPADYGIVAMAFLVVGLIQSLLDFSAATALVRKDKVTRDEIDSAWTLRGIQGLIMAAVMVAAVPFASEYFRDDRVSSILYIFAACVGLSGFANIGFTLAQKNFQFGLEFRFQLYSKILSVSLTIIAGWWLRDYRALVLGVASGYIGGAILSYVMHPYRPRWNTSEIAAIWRITRWLMLANVGGFVLRKGDELIAARIGSANEYGLYNVGADLGLMPTGEVGPAVLRSFLPVLATLTGNIDEINDVVIKTIRVVAAITLPLGFGLAAVAEPVTQIILGNVWAGAAQYVALFSLLGAIYALSGPVTSLMTLRGRTRGLSFAVWFEFSLFALSAFVLVPLFSLLGLVFARLAGAALNMFVVFWLGSRECGLRFRLVLGAIARPLVGSLLMYVAVFGLLESGYFGSLGLPFALLLGVISFSSWCVISWLLIGRPAGLESTVFELMDKIKAFKRAG